MRGLSCLIKREKETVAFGGIERDGPKQIVSSLEKASAFTSLSIAQFRYGVKVGLA